MRIATTLGRYRTRRHMVTLCLTSILITLQPVQSAAVDRIAVLSATDTTQSAYEVTGHVCIVQQRCGLITVTVRSAPDRFPLAPTR
jgi:hypothetical protein